MTSLDRLRTQAKSLRKAAASGDPEARARVSAVFPDREEIKHAHALHILAREAGYPSWPQFKFAIKAAALDRDARAERLKLALYLGQHWVTRQLLVQDPTLAAHNFGLQVALLDVQAVVSVLAEDPGAAVRPIGPRRPILHLAFSHHIHAAPERRPAMFQIAEALVAHGANVNDGYPFQPGAEHKLSALYGALGHARNLPLAEWLLARGADPNDNESLYHACELGNARGLRLLLTHGARPDGTNALLRAMDMNNLEMVEALLAGGASTGALPAPHPSGEQVPMIPALHQAARRWASADIARALIAHGADPGERWHGLDAYAMARVYGNAPIAALLEAAGHDSPLPPALAKLAACADARRPRARIDLQAIPEPLLELPCHVAARPERLAHLETLMLAGFDPDQTESMNLSPLHVAGWEGVAESVRYLLSLGPDLAAKNAYGGDALDTTIHGAEHCPHAGEPGRDHITCAQLLLEAGARLRQEYIDGTGAEDMAAFLESWAADYPESLVP